MITVMTGSLLGRKLYTCPYMAFCGGGALRGPRVVLCGSCCRSENPQLREEQTIWKQSVPAGPLIEVPCCIACPLVLALSPILCMCRGLQQRQWLQQRQCCPTCLVECWFPYICALDEVEVIRLTIIEGVCSPEELQAARRMDPRNFGIFYPVVDIGPFCCKWDCNLLHCFSPCACNSSNEPKGRGWAR